MVFTSFILCQSAAQAINSFSYSRWLHYNADGNFFAVAADGSSGEDLLVYAIKAEEQPVEPLPLIKNRYWVNSLLLDQEATAQAISIPFASSTVGDRAFNAKVLL